MISKYMDKYVAVQMIILAAIFFSALFAHTQITWITKLIGLIVLAAGAMILILSIKALGASVTPVVSPKKDGLLVTSGIYGIVRHPMYSGVITLAIGWSLFFGSWLSLFFSIVLFEFFIVKSKKEEVLLCKKYPEYSQYKITVNKKIIPFIY